MAFLGIIIFTSHAFRKWMLEVKLKSAKATKLISLNDKTQAHRSVSFSTKPSPSEETVGGVNSLTSKDGVYLSFRISLWVMFQRRKYL